MTKIWKVESCIEHVSYSNFEEAVAAARSDESLKEASGKTLRGYRFNGSQLLFEFGDGSVLIELRNSRVEWTLKTETESVNWEPPANEEVVFQLPGGSTFRWKARSILDDLVGRQVWLVASDKLVFIYAKNLPEYLVGFYRKVNDPDCVFLSIGES